MWTHRETAYLHCIGKLLVLPSTSATAVAAASTTTTATTVTSTATATITFNATNTTVRTETVYLQCMLLLLLLLVLLCCCGGVRVHVYFECVYFCAVGMGGCFACVDVFCVHFSAYIVCLP